VTASLAGRTAVVTGASRRAGIGFAIVRQLSALGASIFAQGWSPHDARHPWGADEGAREELAALPSAVYLEADLADSEAPARIVEAARRQFGHLDIIVANHARSGHGRLGELTAAEVDAFLGENVRATLLLVKEFAAQHDGRSGGRVILLTSGQHLGPMPRAVAYAVSKGAIQAATTTLAAELMPRGITVNAVNPGPTATGWDIGDPAGSMPLGRWGEPNDAARLIAWLCGDDARWITGQTIDSEGGFRR